MPFFAWPSYLNLCISVFIFFLTLGIAWYVWKHRNIPGAILFIILTFSGSLWSAFYFLELINTSLASKVVFENFQYSILSIIPLLYFAFITIYSGHGKILQARLWRIFFVEPALNLILIWTNDYHQWFRISAAIETNGLPYPGILNSHYGNWFWFNIIYMLVFFFIILIVLFIDYFQTPRWARNKFWYLIVGVFIPWFFGILSIPSWVLNRHNFVMPLSIAASLLVIAWSLLRTRILDILPIAREALLDQISDAVAVIDSSGRVVELNQAAKRYSGVKPSVWIGQKFTQLLPELSQFKLSTDLVSPQETEITLHTGEKYKVFDVRISPLLDENKRVSGWLAVFNDITLRKEEENKLRQAEALTQNALKESQLHTQELSIIRTSTESLNQANTIRAAIIPTFETLQNIAHKNMTWLLLVDENNGNFHREIYSTPEEPNSPLKFLNDIPNDAGFLALQDFLAGRLSHPQRYTQKAEQIGYKKNSANEISYIAYPLQSGNTLLGILNVAFENDEIPDEETIHLIQTISNSLSVALDRVRLMKSEYNQRRQAEAFREINTTLTASLNLQDVLDLLLIQVARIIPVDAGNVMFVDNEKAWVTRSNGYEFLGEKVNKEISQYSFPLASTPNLQKIIVNKQPVIVNDTNKEPTWYPTVGSEHFLSWLGAPVIINNRVEMIFSLDKKEAGFFQPKHADQLITFCAEASLAIQNARLFEAGQKRIKELESLQATLKDITSQLNVQQLLQDIMARALSLLGSTSGVLGLYRRETDDFKIAVSVTEEKNLSGLIVPANSGLMGMVGQTKLPQTLDDYSSWPGHLDAYLSTFPHAVLEVPLMAGEDLLGALAIGDMNPQRRYNKEDIRLLTLFAQQATIAINNARLFTNARQRAEEAETLRKASTIVASTLEQKEVLHLILEQLSIVVPYDSASIFLLKDGALEMVEGRGFNLQNNLQGLRIPLDQNQPGILVFKEKKTLVVNNMPEEYPAFNEMNHLPILSWIGVPLTFHHNTFGILALDSLQANRYSENHARLAKAFSDQVAIALENVRLYENAVKSANRLETLYRLAQRISAILQPDEVYQAIYKATKDLINPDSFVLSLYNEKSQMINDVFFLDHGLPQSLCSRPVGKGLFSQAIKENRTLVFNEFDEKTLKQTKAIVFGNEKDDTLIQSVIVVPLRTGKKIKGILSIQSYHMNAFTEEDQSTLELLAAQSAVALENARLFSEIQEMAMTDALTKIYNRRMFFDLADQEFSRSHRYKHPLSIIMMDIDRFKLVNDTYGHAAGDIVLTQVAQMCRESLRLVDILARYGGEEFVVMLPETTAAEAQLIAERMRLLIARTAILSEQNSVHITLSFGVVELDPTCKNIEELLNRSDQAMYIAKRKGRNRVSVWSPGLQPH